MNRRIYDVMTLPRGVHDVMALLRGVYDVMTFATDFKRADVQRHTISAGITHTHTHYPRWSHVMHFHLTLPHEFGRIFLNYGPILKSKGVPETREQAAEVYQLYFQLFDLFQCIYQCKYHGVP